MSLIDRNESVEFVAGARGMVHAMLSDAIGLVCSRGYNGRPRGTYQDRVAAWVWFTDDTPHPFGFRWTCDVLSLEPGHIRGLVFHRRLNFDAPPPRLRRQKHGNSPGAAVLNWLLRHGATLSEIGQWHSASVSQVHWWVRDLPASPKRRVQARHARIRALARRGLRGWQIAAQMQLSPAQVSRVMRRLGRPGRPRHEQRRTA
jgi:hypothetical protein